jgi:hypothetical protein
MPSGKVLIGKNGWLFLTTDGVIKDYLGQNRLTSEELLRIKETLENRRAWLAGRGIRYLLVVAPNKQAIYSEMLPDHIGKWGGETKWQQIVGYLKEHSDIDILDLTDAIHRAKEQLGGGMGVGERLFFPNDPHWNDKGAFIGYTEVSKQLVQWFPGIEPLGLNDFEITVQELEGGLGEMMGMSEELVVECQTLIPRIPMHARKSELLLPEEYPHWLIPKGPEMLVAFDNPKRKGRLLVFHDSFFAAGLRDYLSEHFARSAFLQIPLHQSTLEAMVQQERPDLVIEEWAQSTVDMVDPEHGWWGRRWESYARRND